MADYLLVDCVVEKLILGKVLKTEKPWKRTALETKSYYADFFHTENNSMVTFIVYIKNDKHCISRTAFVNQSRFFTFDTEPILRDCAISA